MKRTTKQFGQGMTEYIIIVALIAIAAIAAYSFFGKTLRTQVGSMATELSGDTSSDTGKSAAGEARTEGTTNRNLGTYTGGNK